jgi:CheY-like chemotaxis protein
MLPGKFRLIYTDDDEEDRLLFTEGLNQLDVRVELFLFDNGISLVQYLESVHDAELPSSIVCDMKMHLIDGLEVLKMLKQNSRLKKIPFIIFTTSSSIRDRNIVLASGAEAFFTKPSSINEMADIISQMLTLSGTWVNPHVN